MDSITTKNTANKRGLSNEESNWYEDDCGFKFRRLSVAPEKSTTAINAASITSVLTTTPTTATNPIPTAKTLTKTIPTLRNKNNPGGRNTNSVVDAIKSMLPPSQPPIFPMVSDTPTNPPVSSTVPGAPLKRGRRKSSFALIASRSGRASMTSSFSVSITTKMPSGMVKPADYHKHLLPDLPGPIKMRQLMIWAIQRVTTGIPTKGNPSNSLLVANPVLKMAEDAVKALKENRINTSWYNRPSTCMKVDSPSSTLNGLKNQELQNAILMHQRYQERLRAELQEWQLLQQRCPLSSRPQQRQQEQQHQTHTVASPTETSSSTLKPIVLPPIMGDITSWMNSLPRAIDQLQWMREVAGSFERQSRVYCEGVFQQIRARLLADSCLQPSKDNMKPLLLMKALTSSATSNNNNNNKNNNEN